MSKFFKALEQAERDRALGTGNGRDPARSVGERLHAPEVTAPARAAHPVTEPPDGVDEHLVSLVTPAAFEAEQYRALRHIVEQMHRARDVKVVAVSSPGMGDGKSITSINLAGALAQSRGARVLLVDADLRRPAVGRLLSLEDTEGANLVDGILNPALTLDRIVQSRPPFNLSVICAGQAPPTPYEVLRSPRLEELMEEARRQYDYVVVDTPPLTVVQDCRIMGQWVDGFLLVVAAHRTPRRLIEEALTTLDPTKVLGLVFNGADPSRSGYYSGYYRGDYSADQLSSNGRPGGALKRAARRVGDSFRRSRGASSRSKALLEGGWR